MSSYSETAEKWRCLQDICPLPSQHNLLLTAVVGVCRLSESCEKKLLHGWAEVGDSWSDVAAAVDAFKLTSGVLPASIANIFSKNVLAIPLAILLNKSIGNMEAILRKVLPIVLLEKYCQ